MSSLLFFSFVFSPSSTWERGGVYIIGYREKQSQSLLILFRWIPVENISSFTGWQTLCYFFSTGLKMWLLVRAIFRLSFTRSLGFSCPYLFTTSSVQKTDFLIIYFRWREGVPTSALGLQPIIWLLPFSFPCQATRVRSLSTNICWSSLWPTFFILTCIISLNGHSLTACYC